MKIIFLFLCSILTVKVNAQKSYSILYKYIDIPENSSGRGLIYISNKYRVVCNDSMSFGYMVIGLKDPMKKSKKAFGEKLMPHGTYFNTVSKKMITTGYVDYTGYIHEIPVKSRKWQYLNETKTILGYECKAALSVAANNDSTLVFYAPSMIKNIAPLYEYSDLPGTVLEIFDQAFHIHIIASQITPGHYELGFPKNKKALSNEEVLMLRDKESKRHLINF